MKNYGFEFEGSGWEYFWYTLGWSILLFVTFGIAVPFYIVWNFKWFLTHSKVVRE
jgi:uncharacterized membrane protein YjgN (DUF898 family)